MRIAIARVTGLALLLAGVAGVAAAQQAAPERVAPRLRLNTSEFAFGAPIPQPISCNPADGSNGVSPAFSWSNVPNGTASFAMAVTGTDNHPQKGIADEMFWIIWNIPGTATQLPRNVPLGASLPDGSRQMKGGRNIVGFRSPCPPAGTGPLHYVFTLYALDTTLTLPAEATRPEFEKAMDGHIIGSTIWVGTFSR